MLDSGTNIYVCMNVLFKPKRGRYGIMRGKHMCIVTTKPLAGHAQVL